MSETHVVISASTWRDYSFSIPIAALLWREVIGFHPIVLCVGNWSAQKRTEISSDFMKEVRIDFLDVGILHDYEESTYAQNVRQVGCSLYVDAQSDDWLMPSDADLWPLKTEFYQKHVGSNYKAVCYYANGDHFQGKDNVLSIANSGSGSFQTIPTCHVAMRQEQWRECYPVSNKVSVETSVKSVLDEWLKPKMDGKSPSNAGWEAWMSDQRIITERLCKRSWFPSEVLFVDRYGHPPVDRICRSNWPIDLNLYCKQNGYVDTHIFKAPDHPENWKKLRPIIEHFLPKFSNRIDKYVSDFKESYQE